MNRTLTGAEHGTYLDDIDTMIGLVQQTRIAAVRNVAAGTVPGWLPAVHDALLADVNARRGPRGLASVTRDDIEEIDRLATGADWTRKVAMYAVDLAWGL